MKTLSRKELRSLSGGTIGDWGTCRSDCGAYEPGCYMIIAVCPGDCTAYPGGEVTCSDAYGNNVGSLAEKICANP